MTWKIIPVRMPRSAYWSSKTSRKGSFGDSGGPRSPTVVSIDSPASEEALTELLETAERHSPYVDVFTRGQNMKRIVRLNGSEVQ